MTTNNESGEVSLSRRQFVKTVSATGVGLAVASRSPIFGAAAASPVRKRYAIVGVGARRLIYQDAMEKTYRDHIQLVGFCDTNPGRLAEAQRRSERNGATPPKAYIAADFERMLAEQKPDIVLVTTPDATHDKYIVSAMELGCDVVSEKPLSTTAKKCQRILDAKRRTGRNCRVIFNSRYIPPRSQVKSILMSGEVGDVLSVDFHWMLDLQHGADYFRRWHSHKVNSGGLMVHKATHHFDLMNWWLGDVPRTVYATGKREFYTPSVAKRLGLSGSHERCLTCPEKDKCSFSIDIAIEPLKSLYLDHEKHDGYIRDRCIFRPDIDIEDTMNVLVTYESGVPMTYSLNAFAAWEGYNVVFNGSKGRLEHSFVYGRGGLEDQVKTRFLPLRGKPKEFTPWVVEGAQTGVDQDMVKDLLSPHPPADPYLRAADERAGAASCLIGIAANRCFETGLPVKISDLVTGLTRPPFPPVPPQSGPIAMPPRARAGGG